MTRRGRLLPRALTALAVAAAGLVGASAAPALADPGACTPSTGVVVVVDFRPFGGGLERGCDPTPTTGFEAIHSAGFPTVGTQHDGPGFVCRIKGLPTAAADPCIVTPPATRYWSYWHSDPGQSGWSYSQLGAVSYRPKAGSVDAWVYGATGSGGTSGGPSFSPSLGPRDRTRARTTAAAATDDHDERRRHGRRYRGRHAAARPRPHPRPRPARRLPGRPRQLGARASSRPPRPRRPPPPARPRTDPRRSHLDQRNDVDDRADPSTSASASDPPVSDVRAAPTAAETSTGSPWPAVTAIVLVVAFGAAAAVVALRRRRTMG